MSNFIKPPVAPVQQTALQTTQKEVEWGIRDTEFLLRLIMSSKIDGSDLEIAASTVKKIKELHSSIIDKKVAL